MKVKQTVTIEITEVEPTPELTKRDREFWQGWIDRIDRERKEAKEKRILQGEPLPSINEKGGRY